MDKRLAWFFLALSIIGNTFVPILSFEAQKTLSLFVFLFWWCLFGALFNYAYALIKGNAKRLAVPKKGILPLILILFLEVVNILAYFLGIKLLSPAFVGILLPLGTVMNILAGVLLLRERVNARFAAGAALAILGLIIFRYSTPETEAAYDVRGVWLFLVSLILIALLSVLQKVFFRRGYYQPESMVPLRNAVIALSMFIIALTQSAFRAAQGIEWFYLIVGGFAGPFMNFFFMLRAIKHLPVATVSLVRTLSALTLLIASAFIYRQLPRVNEIIGAVIIFAAASYAVIALYGVPWRRGKSI